MSETRAKNGTFLPGNGGRPKGSRNKLQEAFWHDMRDAWEKHGAEVITRVIEEDPSTFLKVTASQMPKEVEATVEHRSVMRMPEPAKDGQAWLKTTRSSGSPKLDPKPH